MKHESFIYLWYDAPNKMYYLGKHKGTPDDSYTHSSTIWERFTKDNIPKGVRRRILAYGTDEEMCILEHKLLVNRKKRNWNRYYNNSLGDPRYVDQSGENNPMYGRTGENNPRGMLGKKHSEESRKKMSQRMLELPAEKHPRYKHGNAVGCGSPDKEVRSRANKKRESTPERKRYKREQYAKNRDRILARNKEYNIKNKDKIAAQKRAKRQREKQERLQGVGTLVPNMG